MARQLTEAGRVRNSTRSAINRVALRTSSHTNGSRPRYKAPKQEREIGLQPYKGYFVTGDAMPVHPFSPDWYVGGSILVPGHFSSIVVITRFQLQRFTVRMKELAEWFGLEVARLVVDESLRQRQNEWPSISNALSPSGTAIRESWSRTEVKNGTHRKNYFH